MDKIVLSLNKDVNENSYDEDYIDNCVSLINDYFTILEDDNSFELLRYVTIDAKYVNIEFNAICVCLQDILKPHHHVSIPNKFVFEVKVKL